MNININRSFTIVWVMCMLITVAFAEVVTSENADNSAEKTICLKNVSQQDVSEISKTKHKDTGSCSGKIGILDGTVISGDVSFTPCLTKEENIYGASFSLKITKKFENDNNSEIKVKFKGGHGINSSNSSTYACLSSNCNFRDMLKELYYQQSLFNDKITINFGKFGFSSFFATNKCDGFTTDTLSEDCVLFEAKKMFALRLSYALFDEIDISYACFAGDLKDSVNAIQIDYKLFENGVYRIYGWLSSKDFHSFKDHKSKSGTYGFGISADQGITNAVDVFLRFGYTDPSVGIGANSKGNGDLSNVFTFQYPKSTMWSVGVQVKGAAWSRNNDFVGFAVGQIYGSTHAKEVGEGVKVGSCNGTDYKAGPETEMELYYKININKHVNLSPVAQYVVNPKGGNNSNNSGILAFGIKAQFVF